MTTKLKTGILVVAVLILGGCASVSERAAVAMPSPSPGDIEAQIMSVGRASFIVCGVDDDGPRHYHVTVCGDVLRAQTVLDALYPGECVVQLYQPDDGGPHTPRELVIQWWVNRVTGPGFTILSTEILANGTIDVGVKGDLTAAKAVLDREFPGWTEVHTASPSVYLVGNPDPE